MSAEDERMVVRTPSRQWSYARSRAPVQSGCASVQLPDSEILYLIMRYLRTFDGLNNGTNELESQLHLLGAFGTTRDWMGNERQVRIEELDVKYPTLSSDHLRTILMQSQCNGQSRSLLLCEDRFWNPTSQEQREFFSTTSQSLSRLLIAFHHQMNVVQKTRLLHSHILHRISTGFVNEPSVGAVDIQLDFAEDIDLTSDVVLQLKHIGSEKQLSRLDKQITDAKQKACHLEADISSLVDRLRHRGCLISPATRNGIECTVSFLLARSLGRMSLSGASTGPHVASAHHISTSLVNRFQLLYTISGHMTNPAYCCVFDHSGRFVLTGADDYLVKIWDVELGVLVRTCRGHLSYISLIVVSPDNTLFASACVNGSIRIWRMRDGICLRVLQHQADVNWMQFDPATGALISGSDDGTSIVWDLSRLLDCDDTEIPLLDTALEMKAEVFSDCMGPSMSAQRRTRYLPTARSLTARGLPTSSQSTQVPSTVFRKATGLFDWSRSSSDHQDLNNEIVQNLQTERVSPTMAVRDRLELLHVSNLSTTVSEPLKVKCLDIAPLGNVFATGGEDGVVRIWRFGDAFDCSADVNSAKMKLSSHYLRQPKSTFEQKVIRMHGEISEDLYNKLLVSANHQVQRLPGHVSPVTDIKFNSLGDRLLTASTSDGSVRIWSLSADFSESIQVALDLTDNSSGGDPSAVMQSSYPGMRRRGLRNTTKSISVYNICWTCDDLRVVTVQSVVGPGGNLFSRLKVWDSMNGDLLRVISNISDVESKCLARHPLLPHIAITADDAGTVSVWDIESERLVNRNVILHRAEESLDAAGANLVDISISANGERIAVTDILGRLSVLGLDSPAKYASVRSEQYFSSDYLEMVQDAEGNTFDLGTQLPADRSPVGLLCNIHTTPYDVQPSFFCFPSPRDTKDVESSLSALIEDRQRLSTTASRVFQLFAKDKSAGRQPRRDRMVTASDSTRTDVMKTAHSPRAVRSNPTLVLDSTSEDSEHQPAPRQRTAQRRSNIQTLRDLLPRTRYDEVDDSSSPFHESHFHSENAPSRAERAALRAASRNARQQWSRRNNASVLNDTDDSESVNDMAGEVDDEDDDDDDDSDYASDDFVVSRRSNRRVRRRNAFDNNSDDAESVQPSRETIRSGARHDQNRQRQNRQQRQRQRQQRSAAARDRSLRDEALKIDREWLQQDSPNEYLYAPQIGDRVVYFPQGHKDSLANFPESTSPPWETLEQRCVLYECEVRSVSYEIPSKSEYQRCSSVVVVVKLVVVRTPSRCALTAHGLCQVSLVEPRATRHSSQKEHDFEIKLRNSGLPDFLVPYHLFEKSLRGHWHSGIQVLVKLSEKDNEGHMVLTDYGARVVTLSNRDAEWPQSPWEALEVRWEPDMNSGSDLDMNGANQRISPWDARPRIEMATSTSIVSPSLDQLQCQQLEAAIGDCIERSHDKYEPFLYEVDSLVYPHYYSTVAVPMYVDLIRRRLLSGYYRHWDAVRFDFELMVWNCIVFNSDGSPIINLSQELRDELLSLIPQQKTVKSSPEKAVKISTMRSQRQARQQQLYFGSDVEEPSEDKMEPILVQPARRSTRSQSTSVMKPVESDSDEMVQKDSGSSEDSEDNESSDVENRDSDQVKILIPPRRKSSRAQDKEGALRNTMTVDRSNDRQPRRSQRLHVNEFESADDSESESESESAVEEPAAKRRRSSRLSESSNKATHSEPVTPATRLRKEESLSSSSSRTTVVQKPTPTTSTRIAPEIRSKMLEVLEIAVAADRHGYFAEPVVEEEAPNYYEIIEHPMDHSTIRSNISARRYQHVQQVVDDIRLVYSNCETYNDEDSVIARECRRQKRIFEQKLKLLS